MVRRLVRTETAYFNKFRKIAAPLTEHGNRPDLADWYARREVDKVRTDQLSKAMVSTVVSAESTESDLALVAILHRKKHKKIGVWG